MNYTDFCNIRKTLDYRKCFEEGGTLSFDEINHLSTEELENQIKEILIPKIKSLVDKIFQEYSTIPQDNLIVLSVVACNWDGRLYEEFILDIDKANELYYPVGRTWEFYDIPETYEDRVMKISKFCSLIGIKPAEEYYKDVDGLNEVCFGGIGITRDYKVVEFISKQGILKDKKNMNVIKEL